MPRAGELARRLVQPPWRDVLIASGLFASGVLGYLTGLYAWYPPQASVPFWRLGLLAAACAALLLRRRHPALGLALGLPPAALDLSFGVGVSMVLVISDLLYCATAYSSARFSRAMVVAAAVTPVLTLIVALLGLPDWRTAVLVTLQLVALPLIPIAWAREVRRHRESAAAERTRSAQRDRIAELDRRAAITEERSRMARELHDVIAGHLSAIAIQSEAVLSMAQRDPGVVRTVLGSVRENSVAALTEMRSMIDLLRAGDDPPAGPPTVPSRLADLDRLLDSARAGGLRVEPTSTTPPAGLPAVIDLTAYRIVQEALTNAVKHAEGARVWVSLRPTGDRLVIEVTNELTGPAVSRDGTVGGTGVAGMRERAAAVGGSLRAGRGALGWQVQAELPLRQPAEPPEQKVPA
ncbi:MAG: sensor histidine kinase [Pseudonocardiaceae bacterium]